MEFFGRNPFSHQSEFEELMAQCLQERGGCGPRQRCSEPRPGLFTPMGPFSFLAPGVIVPERRAPCRPPAWVKPLNLPDVFTYEDVSIEVVEGAVLLTAAHTFGDEETGTDTVQANRKVDIPENVDPSSVKTLWRKGRLFLRGEWKKEGRKEETAEKQPDVRVETKAAADGPVMRSETEEKSEKHAEEKMEDESAGPEQQGMRAQQPEITEDEDDTAPRRRKPEDTPAAEEERKPLELRLELPSIHPDNISVKLVDDRLIVEGSQQEETATGHAMIHHVRRVVTVPGHIDVERITSSVSDDSVLKIYAPVLRQRALEVREIAVQKEKKSEIEASEENEDAEEDVEDKIDEAMAETEDHIHTME